MQTIVGTVIETNEATYGKDNKTVMTIVVERKEKGGKFTKHIAAKVFGDKAIDDGRKLNKGDTVELVGELSSRKSDKGYWNTDFSVVFVKVLDVEPF